jgi:hypothetical protein
VRSGCGRRWGRGGEGDGGSEKSDGVEDDELGGGGDLGGDGLMASPVGWEVISLTLRPQTRSRAPVSFPSSIPNQSAAPSSLISCIEQATMASKVTTAASTSLSFS